MCIPNENIDIHNWIMAIHNWNKDIHNWNISLNNWILDVHNWIMDTHNWIMDIQNRRIHSHLAFHTKSSVMRDMQGVIFMDEFLSLHTDYQIL